jgi:hypothetical protein
MASARSEAIFNCDIKIQIPSFGCLVIIEETPLLPEVVFHLRAGESKSLPDSLLGREYCNLYWDFDKPDSQLEQSRDACFFGYHWINPINSPSDPYNRPLSPGYVNFHCDKLTGSCIFLFPPPVTPLTVAAGAFIQVVAKTLGTEYCVQPTSNVPIKFADCRPKYPLRKLNDERGTDFTVRPIGSPEERMMPAIFVDKPNLLGMCVLISPKSFVGTYDFEKHGLPIGNFRNVDGRIVGYFGGFPSMTEALRIRSLCAGKWYSDQGQQNQFVKLPDFPMPSKEQLRQSFEEAGIVYYRLMVRLYCNAPSNGLLESRCENNEPLRLPTPDDQQFPSGYIHCKTEATYLKKDQSTGAGWEVYHDRDNRLIFKHWIAAQTKAFQGGQEIEVKYFHFAIPESAKATLGVKLGCNYIDFDSIGKKNGPWTL